MIGHRKAFYRQRSQASSWVRKETVDIDIHVRSMNSDSKIIQTIRIMNRSSVRIKQWNQLSQFRSTSAKIIHPEKKESWLHFNDEPRCQESLIQGNFPTQKHSNEDLKYLLS